MRVYRIFVLQQAHLATKPFINKAIKDYEGFRVICGEDNATSFYAATLFLDFGNISENKDDNNDNIELAPAEHVSIKDGDANSAPPVAYSPVMSLTQRSNIYAKDSEALR